MKNLELSADGPDKKGRHMLTAKPAMRGGGCAFEVGEGDWPQVGPFVDRVLNAMPSE